MPTRQPASPPMPGRGCSSPGSPACCSPSGAALRRPWLYLFAGAAVLFNIGAYWFSDRLALRASRARPLPDGEAPDLRRMVEDLAGRAAVPVPRLYLIGSEQPNAFATGRNPAHAAIAVTEGLLTQLPPSRCAPYSPTSSPTSPTATSSSRRSPRRCPARSRPSPTSCSSRCSSAARDEEERAGAARDARRDDRRADGRNAAPARGLAPARVPGRRDGRQTARARPRRWPTRWRRSSGARGRADDVNPAAASLYIANPLPRRGWPRCSRPSPRPRSGSAACAPSTAVALVRGP